MEDLRLPEVTLSPDARGRDAVIRNIHDSVGWWQNVVTAPGTTGDNSRFGTENDRRNIVLTLNVDGFNPHNIKNNSVSLTPYVFQILNLPENLRHKGEFIIMSAMHPGPREPRRGRVFLQMVIDEIKHLGEAGLDFVDPDPKKAHLPTAKRMMNVKVKLLLSSADYPAHSKNNCQQGAGATYGCMKCEIAVSHLKFCMSSCVSA